MKIGSLDLGLNPLLLAPMEDVSDLSFRKLCKLHGADLLYTEFVSSDAVVRNISNTMRKMTFDEQERPIAIQLYGNDIESMVEAAKIAENENPNIIDINFGCPVKKIANRGAGAGMLLDLPKMIKMTQCIVEAVKLPVTVKTRLGWDEKNKVIVDLAERLQDIGIAALTVHGRTRAQMYTGDADWTLIGEIKNNQRMHIPIIGNGDVISPQRAKYNLDTFGVDALMIGRASIGHPWIFKEIKHYLNTGILLPPPTISEHVEMVSDQLIKSIEWLDERRGILHIRRHLAVTFKGLPNFRPLRIRLLQANTQDEVLNVLNEIKVIYANHIYSAIEE